LTKVRKSLPVQHWNQGWWSHAKATPSPNFGTRPEQTSIDLVVLHSISLPPGRYGGNEVEDLFTNQLDWSAHPYFESIRGMQVSSHFFIRRAGFIQQFVSADARAWHAGRSQFDGREDCNNFSIGIELEGLEGERFTAKQYSQLARLCRALKTQYPIKHVVGHEHVAPGRKQDPGSGFDWLRLSQAVAWPPQCFPVLSIL
jgi:N-acetyl-anhydromuramoyl-L-alanine amidase